MKRSALCLFLIVLLVGLVSISLADAATDSGIPEGTFIAEGSEDIEDIGKVITEEGGKEYLKKEWEKILEKSETFGPAVRAYKDFSPYTDPVFRYTIGMTPSLSWLFALTLVLWIAFVIYIFRAFEAFGFYSKWAGIGMSFALVIIISMFGFVNLLAELIINAIALTDIWWVQLILIGIVIVGLIVASIFSKAVKDFFRTLKKRRKAMKIAQDVEDLKQAQKASKYFRKGLAFGP